MSKLAMKEAFEVEFSHESFYTGDNISWSEDGENLFCQNEGSISVVSVNDGLLKKQIGKSRNNEGEDPINSFAISNDNLLLVTQHKSSLFKLWNWKEDVKLLKMWKSIHRGPVARLTFFNGDMIVASGGCDSSVRLWNLQQQSCTHNLKGLQGVVSVLAFHPDPEKEILFAAGDDATIHGWNIKTGQNKFILNGHFSKVTSLSFHQDGLHMLSSGRDKVLILWDIVEGVSLKVFPVYEEIEAAFLIPTEVPLPKDISRTNSGIYAISAGERGVMRLWKMNTGEEIYVQNNSMMLHSENSKCPSIVNLLFNANSNSVATISVDHNIMIYSFDTFDCKKQLIGHCAEILDVIYVGKEDSHLALASNNCDIKFYHLLTMNCQLLRGHTDFVMSLSSTPANRNLFASSGKDKSIRLWLLDEESLQVSCVAVGIRHTESVASITLSQMSTKFLISVSRDLCLKLWDTSAKFDMNRADLKTLTAIHSVKAHDSDINCVTLSPNDKFIATGALDKTAKLWDPSNLQLLGVFRGHKRSIWCVRFSPVDHVLLTSSADCTIRIWSLVEFNCLKTLQGHEASVIKAEFLSRGMQIVTSSADGLIKLWDIKTSECIATMDKHESAVWAIRVNRRESHMISGGSDSKLIIWRDITEERRAKIIAEKERLVVEEEKLANLIEAEQLTSALNLSLKLERPLQTLKIIEDIIKKDNQKLIDIIQELKPARQEVLLKFAVIWNTNSRNCQVSQLVIHALLNEICGKNCSDVGGISSSLETLIPYTDRHFKRLTRLLQDLHFFIYSIHQMKSYGTSMDIDCS